MVDRQNASGWEAQRENIRRVRLSLLATERHAVTGVVPDGFVFDLFGAVLTEGVAAERIQAIMVGYVVRAVQQHRKQVVPQPDGEAMLRVGVSWRVSTALTATDVRDAIRAQGVWVSDAQAEALVRFGGFILGAALDARMYDTAAAIRVCDDLYMWWLRMCDLCGVVTG